MLLPLELVTTSPTSQFMIVVLFTIRFCGHYYECDRFKETRLAPPDADVWVANILGNSSRNCLDVRLLLSLLNIGLSCDS